MLLLKPGKRTSHCFFESPFDGITTSLVAYPFSDGIPVFVEEVTENSVSNCRQDDFADGHRFHTPLLVPSFAGCSTHSVCALLVLDQVLCLDTARRRCMRSFCSSLFYMYLVLASNQYARWSHALSNYSFYKM